MRFGMILIALGFVLIQLGLFGKGLRPDLLWLGFDFTALGVAHLLGASALYGKRRDGTIPWWSWIVFLPLFLITHAVWHLFRLLARDAKANEVSEELTVGRRQRAGELEGDFANYVDLTAEFSAPLPIREAPSYLNFPILDGGTPSTRELRAFIRSLRPGRTFVHCAQGRGRAGLFAVAMLLHSKAATNVEEALRILRSARPGVQLNRNQRRCAETFARELRAQKLE
jgi:hypothetical protein